MRRAEGRQRNVSNGLKFFNRVSSSACPPPTAFINNQNLNRRFDDVGQAEGVELVLLYVMSADQPKKHCDTRQSRQSVL